MKITGTLPIKYGPGCEVLYCTGQDMPGGVTWVTEISGTDQLEYYTARWRLRQIGECSS
jgi:hypothetical protein